MNKRIKSFLITASSIFTTAFIAATFTPEWANFLLFANDKLLGLGVPAVVIGVLGVLVSEVWKQLLNNHTISKATKNTLAGKKSFVDTKNELY